LKCSVELTPDRSLIVTAELGGQSCKRLKLDLDSQNPFDDEGDDEEDDERNDKEDDGGNDERNGRDDGETGGQGDAAPC